MIIITMGGSELQVKQNWWIVAIKSRQLHNNTSEQEINQVKQSW